MKHFLIIGSGIGGMASGALLAKAGHRVTLWEQHPEMLGGHGRCLVRGGLSFSMGPQYVWDFGRGDIGERFLQFLNIHNENPFLPMSADDFEHLFVGERGDGETSDFIEIRVPMGLSLFCSRLRELFPEEEAAIFSLFQDMEAIYGAYRRFFRHGGKTAAASPILPAFRFLCAKKATLTGKARFGKSIFQTLRSFYDQYGVSERVRRILYAHGGIFAENESQMSAIAYIIGTGNYHRGAWYPENGFRYFFQSLARVIEEEGGRVMTGKRAVRLRSGSGRITRAEAEDGTICSVDGVVSDISPRLTCALLGSGAPIVFTDYEPSHSIISCCIGLAEGFGAVRKMRGKNCWWQSG
jgi:all-trans-retinol 13,14-reductase